MEIKHLIIVSLVALTQITPIKTFAADPPAYITIGQRFSLGSPAGGVEISVSSYDNRSYCCTIINSTSVGLPAFTAMRGFLGDTEATVVNRGFSGNASGVTITDARRRCWHEVPSGGRQARPILTIGQPGTAQPVAVLCEETSLVGGFNTSATDFNFLEISATAETGGTSQNIQGMVVLDTTIAQEQVTVPFSIEFGGDTMVRRDFAIRDLIGGRADFGQVRVLHNAAPGVIKAKVTQYKIVSQQPLDFVPVLQEVLVRRVEK